jgi:hypothetical protein
VEGGADFACYYMLGFLFGIYVEGKGEGGFADECNRFRRMSFPKRRV